MKTTVELPDSLLREAKAYAARHGIPVREVMERGLRMVLENQAAGRHRFRLKSVTTKGEGLACGDDWSVIRSLAYEGHGG